MEQCPFGKEAGTELVWKNWTDGSGRGLFIVFTLRGSLIRVISARDMSKKERSIYYDAKKESNQEST